VTFRVSFLTSPRMRRRLAWLAVILGSAGAVVLVAVLLPKHGGPRVKPGVPSLTSTGPAATSPDLGFPDPATERARTQAVAAVRPLAARFLTALIRQRDPALARSFLVPALRSRSLPLTSLPRSTLIPGASVAFSGPTIVGLVYGFADANVESILLAVRVKNANGRWLIDYLRQGHSSRSISETNFSPPGFSPGSQSTSLTAWLPLLLGLVVLILLVVLVERALSRSRRRKFL
jgi:hypothetical protein